MTVITISRGSSAGGRKLAEELAARLGYQLVSREVLAQASEREGVSVTRLAEEVEREAELPRPMRRARRLYLATIQSALCEYVRHDNVVYHGHAGHLLLRGVRHVLTVRLIAPLEYRIEWLTENQDLTRSEATRYIDRMDRRRRRWSQFLYDRDWQDPALYDLVVNLGHLSLESAAHVVITAAGCPEFQADAASQQALENLLLASRVRLALAREAALADAEPEVEARGGTVRLWGLPEGSPAVALAQERVKALPGVAAVKLEAPPAV